jgi:hypothetical protein
MMPRLCNSTAAVIAASGAFATKRDAVLWTRLHAWLQRSAEANARFALTEAITFEHPKTAAVINQALASGAVIKATREALEDLANVLMDAYKKESGIDRDTELFPSPDDKPAA